VSSVSASAVASLIDRFRDQRVLIVGDVMLDQFLAGRVSRISPEAPVPVVHFEQERCRLGGAANVAHNVRRLGGIPVLVGVLGADADGERVRARLAEDGIESSGLVEDPGRCTTRKLRIVTERNQQVARIDFEDDREIDDGIGGEVAAAVESAIATAGAVVVSDYLKGVVTAPVMERLLRAAGRRVPTIVDPKIPHLDRYRGATLVTPNHHEAELATHRPVRRDEDARAAARAFREQTGCQSVLITRGEQGMWLLDAGAAAASHGGAGSGFEGPLPAVSREVADVTGAGDTVVATVALALAAAPAPGALLLAATLAAHAAGVAVGKFGTAAVSADELRHALSDARDLGHLED